MQIEKILIAEKQFDETPGLLELLFKKNPAEEIINASDIKQYQEIVEKTHLLKKYIPNRSNVTVAYNKKYLKYLKEINPAALKNSKIGKGLPKFMISKAKVTPLDYKYWDDPN